MVPNAEVLLQQLITLEAMDEPVFELQHGPRLTRIGCLLRRWSVDEPPQPFKVLKGEMSVVGPRPEEMRMVHYRNPWHRQCLQATRGVTGPVQISGWGDLSLEESPPGG